MPGLGIWLCFGISGPPEWKGKGIQGLLSFWPSNPLKIWLPFPAQEPTMASHSLLPALLIPQERHSRLALTTLHLACPAQLSALLSVLLTTDTSVPAPCLFLLALKNPCANSAIPPSPAEVLLSLYAACLHVSISLSSLTSPACEHHTR